jgi:MFS family permease
MKSWIKKIFGFGLASLLSDFSHEMTISLVPVIVAQFVHHDYIPLFLGVLASTTEAFASFLRIFSGYFTDKIANKKPLIAVGYALSALFSTLLGFSQSAGEVLIFRMLSFAGSGLREPPRDAVIAATIEPQNYGRAFGLRNAMDTTGALLGPLVAFLCTGIISVHGIFLISFIPGFFSVLAIIFLTKDITIPVKKTIVKPSFWNNISLLPYPFIIFISILFIFDLGSLNKLLLLARAQQILTVNTTSLISSLVLLYACFNITRIAAEFCIGLLSDYINRIMLLALFGCATFIGALFLMITPHASLSYCTLIFALAGISAAAMTTLKKACAADMLPANIRGLGYGVLQANQGFAALIANVSIGALWTYFSPLVAFVYAIIVTFFAALLLIVFAMTQNYHKQPAK